MDRAVPVRTVVALSPEEAHALGDPTRVAILDLLATRPMAVDELDVELRRQGLAKAPTTLRYHLERLKRSGLIELALLREARGAVLRYYAATARSLHYELPHEDEGEAAALSALLSTELKRPLQSFLRRYSSRIESMALRLRPCPHCPTQHFEEYVTLALVQRALADLTQRQHLLSELARSLGARRKMRPTHRRIHRMLPPSAAQPSPRSQGAAHPKAGRRT